MKLYLVTYNEPYADEHFFIGVFTDRERAEKIRCIDKQAISVEWIEVDREYPAPYSSMKSEEMLGI